MSMDSVPKYRYPAPIPITDRQWPDRVITRAPRWVSVDLRDGNQAFPVPMNPDQKLEFFNMLVGIGFKEIEVSFPSASQDDFDFVRRLIGEADVPADVRISVLTQAREHLIDRTAQSLVGARKGLLHCYVPTSDLHGRFVFGKSRPEVLRMAVDGTKMVRDAMAKHNLVGDFAYEFSPEEFTDSDLDFVVELCAAVKDAWGPARKEDFILNLPATVERRPPTHYADMIELFIRKYPYMDETTVSLHEHNDQGYAVASSELALQAGATRVEGTIFGHGERTGNLDLSILALNLYSRGIDTGLDFSNLPKIVEVVERMSGIDVHPRHPYAGALVFTAFSGSHQDAIRKGLEQREETRKFFNVGWKVPYLHVDPRDLGRDYEGLIRINSQSGKGGMAYVLETKFGIYPPKAMHPQIGSTVQTVLDREGGELSPAKLHDIFNRSFVNIEGPLSMTEYVRSTTNTGDRLGVSFTLHFNGHVYELTGQGNGPLSAVVNALKQSGLLPEFSLADFSERTLGADADAKAMAFVGVTLDGVKDVVYGAGVHSNIDRAAIAALFSALNRAFQRRG